MSLFSNMGKKWEALSDFLEEVNVIPVILLSTIYHYFEALGRHGDPLPVAAAIAIVVDLSHYRSVREAVSSGRWVWRVAAGFTTALSFLLQYAFYNGEGGLATFSFEAVVYAAVAPGLILLVAWRAEEVRGRTVTGDNRRRDSKRRGRGLIKKLRAALATIARLTSQLTEAQSDLTLAKSQLKAAEEEANTAKEQAKAAESQANLAESQAKAAEEKLRDAVAHLKALQIYRKAIEAMDEIDRAILLNHITAELNQTGLAERLNISASTISERKKRLNLNGTY
jgi:multidrug efflux pump subunit AcrA (membrane-fusion protein)